jgi:thiol-disulfide isomerase/thioredoxin
MWMTDTLISLPDFLFHLLGIVMGYLFYKSTKVFRTIIVLLSLSCCLFIYFKGYEMWHHKLNFGTFTGKPEQTVVSDFQFADEKGQLFSINDFAGKYTIVDCWFTGCGICFRDFPKVQALYAQYKDHPSVSILSMNSRLKHESDSVASAIIREKGYSFPVYRLDMENPVLHQIGVYKYPTVLIFDKESRLVFRGSIENASKQVSKLLKNEKI